MIDELTEDEFTDLVRDTLLRVMGVLYESQLVEDIDAEALMLLMQVDEETLEQFRGVYIDFDDTFFEDYQQVTGIELRQLH